MEEIKNENVTEETPKKRGRKKVEEVEQPAEEEIVHPDDPRGKKKENKTLSKEEKKEELVNVNQMNVLKLALGWNESNPLRYPTKGTRSGDVKGVLYSYRNRFFTDPKPQLEDLVAKGFMERAQFGTNGITHSGYKVTQKGIDHVAEANNIVIKFKDNRK